MTNCSFSLPVFFCALFHLLCEFLLSSPLTNIPERMSRNISPVRKRNFAKAKDTDGIIDLCSPVPTKPCRKQTPTISSQPNPALSSISHPKASVAASLFQEYGDTLADVSRGNSLLTMEDEEDGYWEPAGYGSPREHANDTSAQNQSEEFDEQSTTVVGVENRLSKHPQNSEAVIDLCSPASSKHSPLHTRGSQLASTSPSILDRTLHSSDDEEGSEGNASGTEPDDTENEYIVLAQNVPSQENEIEARTYTSLSDRLAARRAFPGNSQSQYSEHIMDTISVHSASSYASSVAPARAASPPMSLFSQVMRNSTSLHNYSNAGSSSSYEKSVSSSQTVQVTSSGHTNSNSTTVTQQTKGSSLRSKFLAVEKNVLGDRNTIANTVASVSRSTPAPVTDELIRREDEAQEDIPAYRPKPFLPSDFDLPRSALSHPEPPTTATVSAKPAAQKVSTSSILRRAESVSVVPSSSTTSSSAKSSSAVTAASTLYRATSVGSASLNTTSTSQQVTKSASITQTQNSSAAAPTNPDGSFRSRYSEKSLGTLPALPSDCHWQVLLLIDKRERCNELIQTNMAARNIPCQLSTLAVGDFLWVIRPVTAAGVPATLATATSTTSTLFTSATTTTAVAASTMTSTASIVDESSNSALPRKGNKTSKTTQSKAQSKITSFVTSDSQVYNTDEDTQMSIVSTLGAEEEENETADPAITTRTYVLDCIAERKSIADLASSMCDGRYNEQKARLKACNLRSTMYIVEGEHIVVSQHQKAISSAHIKTAMISINVDSGMHVLRTRSMDHTIICLQNLHRQVERRFQKQLAEGSHQYQTFGEFQSMYSKKAAATNRQLFGHQLRQIQGCSTSVALTLMNKYGTTARFMDELKTLGWTKAQYTLENIVNEVSKRRLGKAVATRICQIYLTTF